LEPKAQGEVVVHLRWLC